MQLVLDTRGLRVRKRNGCFHLKTEGQERLISPLKVGSIAVTSPCMLSSAAIDLAILHQIPIYFLNRRGRVTGRLWSARFGPQAELRRQQALFGGHPAAAAWVVDLYRHKTEGQLQVLRHLQNRRPSLSNLLQTTMQNMQVIADDLNACRQTPLTDCADTLRGLEGSIARHYWVALATCLPEPFCFETRNRHPATDPFNAALNYAYGMFYTSVETALFAAGLDPYLGIFHADQYAKPTLSYDLIEPFRPWADRVVIDLCLKNQWPADAFETKDGAVHLAKSGKRLLIPAVNVCLLEKADFGGRRAPAERSSTSLRMGWPTNSEPTTNPPPMLYLVSYDMEADALRLAVAKQLLALGLERVQRSVFIGPLDPDGHRSLLDWLARCLPDDESIQLLVLPLTQYSIHQAYCRGQPPPDWTYLAGEAHTLIF